jgi:sporulation protein YlmC with PRC-barrel domain
MNDLNKDNMTGKNHSGAQPNRPLTLLTATSIMGDHVHNYDDQHLGTIKDIMINLHEGNIEYIIIELGGFLGIGEKYFAIPYRLLKVNPKNNSFTLNQSKEVLSNAPGFDKDHWPETNSHSFEKYDEYWGGFMGSNTGLF